MEAAMNLNLALAFALELAMLAAFAYFGGCVSPSLAVVGPPEAPQRLNVSLTPQLG